MEESKKESIYALCPLTQSTASIPPVDGHHREFFTKLHLYTEKSQRPESWNTACGAPTDLAVHTISQDKKRSQLQPEVSSRLKAVSSYFDCEKRKNGCQFLTNLPYNYTNPMLGNSLGYSKRATNYLDCLNIRCEHENIITKSERYK